MLKKSKIILMKDEGTIFYTPIHTHKHAYGHTYTHFPPLKRHHTLHHNFYVGYVHFNFHNLPDSSFGTTSCFCCINNMSLLSEIYPFIWSIFSAYIVSFSPEFFFHWFILTSAFQVKDCPQKSDSPCPSSHVDSWDPRRYWMLSAPG